MISYLDVKLVRSWNQSSYAEPITAHTAPYVDWTTTTAFITRLSGLGAKAFARVKVPLVVNNWLFKTLRLFRQRARFIYARNRDSRRGSILSWTSTEPPWIKLELLEDPSTMPSWDYPPPSQMYIRSHLRTLNMKTSTTSTLSTRNTIRWVQITLSYIYLHINKFVLCILREAICAYVK